MREIQSSDVHTSVNELLQVLDGPTGRAQSANNFRFTGDAVLIVQNTLQATIP